MTPQPQFAWDRSRTLALAKHRCAKCSGLGNYFSRNRLEPCNCVLRAIFRACLARYRHIQAREKYESRVTLDFFPRGRGQHSLSWSRRDEEYCADFWLLGRRTLDPFHFAAFRLHFLEGRPWNLCVQSLHTDRGNFFHAIYRLQAALGRISAELLPYPLWPLDSYFQPHHTFGPIAIFDQHHSVCHYREIEIDRLRQSNGQPQVYYHLFSQLRKGAA